MNLEESRTWQELPGIEPLQSVPLVAHGNSLIRVGGMRATNEAGQDSDLVSVAEVARYHISSQTWTRLPDLPEARSSHDAVVVGDTLYVIGGWRLEGSMDDGTWQSKGLALDLGRPNATWKEFDVPFERRALAIAVAGERLVIIGGMDADGQHSRRVDIYDVGTRTWTRGPDFPASGFGVSAIGVGTTAYASGMDGTVQMLVQGGDAWQPLTKLVFPRFFHRLVRGSDTEILAVGGILGMKPSDRVRQIERVALRQDSRGPRVMKWTLAAPGPAKNRQGVFLRKNTLYVFGGNNSLEQHDFEPENFIDNAFKLHIGTLSWEPMKSYPVKRQTMQTELDDKQTFGIAVGGFGHDGEKARTHAESFLYDFDEDTWTPRPGTLAVARSQFGLIRVGDELWIFGGLDYDPSRAESERFRHPESVLVSSISKPEAPFVDRGFKLPRPRRALGGALLDGRYYLVGGMRENFQLVEACDVFEFATKTWTTIAAPQKTRISPELVALGGKLYLASGATLEDGDMVPEASIEVYDPATNTWSVLIEKLPIDTTHMRMFAFRDRLLIYTAQNEAAEVHLLVVDPGM
jgi:N-acetylneuraminic acid mutarotase